jgi:hypothetical protein
MLLLLGDDIQLVGQQAVSWLAVGRALEQRVAVQVRQYGRVASEVLQWHRPLYWETRTGAWN